jgi:protein-tyrosine kinase
MAPTSAECRTMEYRAGKDVRIGALLVAWGRLTDAHVDDILRRQASGEGVFGEIAAKLGLIQEEDLEAVLRHQGVHRSVPLQNVVWPRELVAARPAADSDIEVFRELRLQLLKRWFALGHRSLAFLSPDPDVGLSFFVANLALVFAHAHQSTLLIDANLRMPSQHTIFKIDDGFGLSDILSSSTPADCSPHHTAFRNLSVLVSGKVPKDPYELLASNAFSTVSARLASRYDITLFDLAPFNAGADALAVAAEVGGALLVTRRHRSRLADVVALENKLRNIGTQLVGSVMLDF